MLVLQAVEDKTAPAEDADALKKEDGDRVTVVAIPKAATLDHVKEDAGAAGWRMSEEDYEALNRAFTSATDAILMIQTPLHR